MIVEVWRADALSAELANSRLLTTEVTHVVWVENGADLEMGSVALIEATLARFEIDILYGNTRDPAASDGPITVRPTFSPLRLREQNYLGSVVVMSVSWMRSVGGFDPRAAGVHGYDFVLRFSGSAHRVVHVPESLCSQSVVRDTASAECDAVTRRLASRPPSAVVSHRPDATRRVAYELVGNPLVSVVIPTRGSSAVIRGSRTPFVVEAVRGLIERTDYLNLELVVVADDPTPQPVIDALVRIAGDRLRLVRYSEPFNFSAKVNRGAVYARGDYLLLLNDDVDVIHPEWLARMLALVQQPDVGIVGSLLLFEDGLVQHGGHLHHGSWAGHIRNPEEIGVTDKLQAFGITREVSGVTAACALLSAETFWRVGGLSTEFPGNYNDVDLCLKIRSSGGSAVFTPDARLFHFESKTRDASIRPDEIARLRQRWGTNLLIDQFWAG